MKAYVMTTGAVFGLLTLAHIWRVIEEGPHLARGALVRTHNRCRRSSLPLGFALALALAAIMTVILSRLICVAPDKAVMEALRARKS